MQVAVVGATGLVGQKMLQVLEERNFPVDRLIPVASEKSIGKRIRFKDQDVEVVSWQEAIAQKPSVALFSAGGSTSLELAPHFAAAGIRVIDNSSAWRMQEHIKLVVPEVNGQVLSSDDFIIANPNCSTIQLVMALKPLHDAFRILRVVVSTYQSVSGTGVKAVQQLEDERKGVDGPKAYPYPIDLNAIPHIDVFMENGYSKEEMKMIWETKKIMQDNTIAVTATTVRIPVMGGHSESVNIEFDRDFTLTEVRNRLSSFPGVRVLDEPEKLVYPMPLYARHHDEVFVGRIRRDESQPNTLNCWIVSDNLRKGAATNAVQIAEYLHRQGWI
ncbi:MAG: aspartate-semialdehyde dehydrogenase [Chitinophagaceae bacterium]|nr:aspartate-semialdehyde dehydrogenase [Chitinophagaceae bacterium]